MGINRTAHTFGAEAATSTLMNAEVKALWDDLQEDWDTYTPTWSSTGTAPAVANGAIAGEYRQIGKTLDFYISFQAGSTSTYGTGFYLFSLPPGLALDRNDWDAVGVGTCWNDSSSEPYGFTAMYDDTGFVRLVGSDGTKVGPTTPFTFNTSDRIIISGRGKLP